MIELKNLSKFYYKKGMIASGISKVSLQLSMGEFVVITGESGSGKSTLLNVISGLDTYEEGEMYIEGKETSHYTPSDFEEYRKKYIGNVFQNFNLVSSYTVYQNVELILLIEGSKKEDIKERVNAIIRRVGLYEYRNTKVSKLSGGQKQRVAIARALAKDTPVIVADEPTGNLDIESAKSVVELLHSLAKGKLVIIVTHNYEQFENYATRRIKMSDGKIIEDDVMGGFISNKLSEDDEVCSTREGGAEASGVKAVKKPEDDQLGAVRRDEQEEGNQECAIRENEHAEDGKITGVREGESIASSIKDGKQLKDATGKGIKKTEYPYETPKSVKRGEIDTPSKIRLGIRNTFNIFTKFLLLLLVFIFLIGGTITEYTSYLQSMKIAEEGRFNQFFTPSSDRIVFRHSDKKPISDKDVAEIKKISNVKSIVTGDIVSDQGVSIEGSESYFSGYPKNRSVMPKKVDVGRLPKADDEFVLETYSQIIDTNTKNHKDLLNKYFKIYGNSTDKEYSGKLVGIKYMDTSNGVNINIDGNIYLSDSYMQKLKSDILAALTYSECTINGKIKTNTFVIESNVNVPKGFAYVPEEVDFMFETGSSTWRPIKIVTKNIFFSDELTVTSLKTYTKENYKKLLGVGDEKAIEDIGSTIFINPEDYQTLFGNKPDYQGSVYVNDTDQVGETVKTLKKSGYNVIALKDARSSNGDTQIIKVISTPIIFAIVVGMFFISYFVIKLILRSRKSYFSILRILGMKARDIKSVISIELFTVMNVGYIFFMGLLMMNAKKVFTREFLTNITENLRPTDYVIVYVVLIFMTWLISKRFASSLFRKSAIGTFREEA